MRQTLPKQTFQQKLNHYNETKQRVTKPQFKVGDWVIAKFPPDNPEGHKVELYGKIVNMPPNGKRIFDNQYKGSPLKWQKNDPSFESFEDIPGSGSVWFLPDMSRKYFVKLR